MVEGEQVGPGMPSAAKARLCEAPAALHDSPWSVDCHSTGPCAQGPEKAQRKTIRQNLKLEMGADGPDGVLLYLVEAEERRGES